MSDKNTEPKTVDDISEYWLRQSLIDTRILDKMEQPLARPTAREYPTDPRPRLLLDPEAYR